MVRAGIIGGGPAGSTAAYYLARSGIAVTLFESREPERIKVCGEYISPAATDLLEAVISAEELERAGARRISRFRLEAGSRHAEWDPPHGAWSISRSRLDSMLLDKARRAGANAEQPAAVRKVLYTERDATVVLSDGRQMEFDHVIHADGHGRHDPASAVPLAPLLIAHKCHLHIPDAMVDTVTMRACAGAYVGTISVEDGLSTCAFVGTRDLTHRFPDGDALLAHLWPRYRRSWRMSEWSSCGVPRCRYIRPGHHRSLRIGNAAGAVDPIGGEGIGLALWAGAQVGTLGSDFERVSVLRAHEQACQLQQVERGFAAKYRARLRWRLPTCRGAGWLLMRPGWVRALWPFVYAPALSFRPFYRLSGKASPG